MNDKDRALLVEFKNNLSSNIKNHLRRLIAYGSRVRGEALDDSDIDVLALVDEKTPEIERLFEETAYGVMWNHDFKPVISLKVIVEKQFNNALNKGFSFYKHVAHEGVSI